MGSLRVTWTKVSQNAALQHHMRGRSTGTLPSAFQIAISSERPIPRVGAPLANLGSTLYLFSGRGGVAMEALSDGPGAIWSIETTLSDPAWTLLEPTTSEDVPEPRSYHALAADPSSQTIYLHAGCPASGRLIDLWSFSVKERKWTRLASAPGAPRGGTSITFAYGKLWRMNGFDGKQEVGGVLDAFDSNTGKWESVDFKPDGKEGPGARSVGALLPVEVDGRAYLLTLLGEGDPSSLGHAGAGKMWSDVWEWDIEEKKWQEVSVEGERPAARGWFGAAALSKDEICVQGGLGEDNERLDDLWAFKLSNA